MCLDQELQEKFRKFKRKHAFFPLNLLKQSLNPIEADIFKKESEIYRKILNSKAAVKGPEEFELKCATMRGGL